MVTPIQDYYIVSIERQYEDTKSKRGIILLNSAWLDDSEMDRYQHKRLYGNVLSVPAMFSDTPYMAIDDGMPSYRKFVGHDDIADRINRGYNNHTDKVYYPSTYDKYQVITFADIARSVHVENRDKAYFLPQVTEPENFIEKDDKGQLIYKVCVTDIMCVVREGKIIMQGEWVLVSPNMETWEEITTKTGIIMKPNPEKKWLEGIIAHSNHDHLKVGAKIVYLPNADCEVKVEGQTYFVMPSKDIIGQLN